MMSPNIRLRGRGYEVAARSRHAFRSAWALQTLDSGSIMFRGIDVLAEPATLREVLGYLPPEFRL